MNTIAASGITIDPAKRRVACDGREVSLTPQEFTLLYLLANGSRPIAMVAINTTKRGARATSRM